MQLDPKRAATRGSESASAHAGNASSMGGATPPATHDLPPAGRLEQWMATGWEAAPAALATEPEPAAGRARERRITLSQHFPGDTLVVPSGSLKIRANDTDYP